MQRHPALNLPKALEKANAKSLQLLAKAAKANAKTAKAGFKPNKANLTEEKAILAVYLINKEADIIYLPVTIRVAYKNRCLTSKPTN